MSNSEYRAELVERAWAAAFAAFLCGAINVEVMLAVEDALSFPPRPPSVPEWASRTGRTQH